MSKKNNTTGVPLFEAEFREIIRRFDAEPELGALLETIDVDTDKESEDNGDTSGDGEAIS